MNSKKSSIKKQSIFFFKHAGRGKYMTYRIQMHYLALFVRGVKTKGSFSAVLLRLQKGGTPVQEPVAD